MTSLVKQRFESRSKSRSKSKSKSNNGLDRNDNNKESLEILPRSVKPIKKQKTTSQFLHPNKHIQLPDSDNEIHIRSSLNSNPIIYRNQCPCDTHYNKQLMENNYTLPVNKVFDLIFGTNEFVDKFRQAQKFFDITESEWLLNEGTNYRERTLKYKVPYEAPFFGSGTIFTREKQTIFHEVPNSHYVLETEIYNEGVKYCDTFSLIIRYCLVQTSTTTTNLRVTACIIFNRTVNAFLKQMIERNTYSASHNGLKDLNNRLSRIDNYKWVNIKINFVILIIVFYLKEKRRLSDNGIVITIPKLENIKSKNPNDDMPVLLNNNQDIHVSNSDKMMHILIFLVALLILLHIYLYMRLRSMDSILERLAQILKI